MFLRVINKNKYINFNSLEKEKIDNIKDLYKKPLIIFIERIKNLKPECEVCGESADESNINSDEKESITPSGENDFYIFLWVISLFPYIMYKEQ